MPDSPSDALSYVEEATCFAGPLAATIAEVLHKTSTTNGVGWTHVVGKRSNATLARARRAVALALRSIDTGEGRRLSYSEIGCVMGGKDHSTVLYYLGALKRQRPEVPVG